MNLDHAPIRVRNYWNRFDPQSQQAHRFYEPFQVGLAEIDADHGARLILNGEKTATSSMLWEYEHTGRELPAAGSLSVVMDGRYEPVAVVESTSVEIIPFNEVDAAFCIAYGEADGSIDAWRELTWRVYQVQCEAMGFAPSMDMPLVCEYLSVHFPDNHGERQCVIEAIDAAIAKNLRGE